MITQAERQAIIEEENRNIKQHAAWLQERLEATIERVKLLERIALALSKKLIITLEGERDDN